MRFTRLSIGIIPLVLTMFMMVGCLNEDNKIPPNCYDGELNNDEFDVDCGGPNCPDCPPSCFNGIWDVLPELNWVEEETDCGGPCIACPTCDDAILNQDETGIDCGGIECPDCPVEAGDCTNGILDGDETGIDCGGCCCPDCPEEAGDCTNGAQDGDEEGIDCGGSACPPCVTGAVQYDVVGDMTYTYSLGTASFDGDNTLTLAGIDAAVGSITFIIPEGIPGWVDGLNVTFNPGTAPDQTCNTIDLVSSIDLTSTETGADLTMFISTVGTTAGSTVAGTFSGTLVPVGGGTAVDVVNGVFSVTVF